MSRSVVEAHPRQLYAVDHGGHVQNKIEAASLMAVEMAQLRNRPEDCQLKIKRA